MIAARDNSPAAKAGLRTGDYIRAINDMPTRDMSVWEGMRTLRGAPGSKVSVTIIRGNANDPHVVELTRETEPASVVNGRMAGTGIGYVRVAAIGPNTAAQVKSQIAELTKSGASKLVVDVRRASNGTIDEGLAHRAAVRRQGHAGDPRGQGRRARDDRRRGRRRLGDAADRGPGRHRHVRRRRRSSPRRWSATSAPT